jgi:hypothetical protein|tara:strand:+ start:24990 stop:25994 length:1005 start_codon:yes stop_codon:yes gene_type:complete
MAFFTKVDYNRQLRQSGGTATFSGSTHMTNDLSFVGHLSGYVADWQSTLVTGSGFPCSTGNTFMVGPHYATSASCNVNITSFSGVSGTTAVLSIGQVPIDPISGGSVSPGISASTLQIKNTGLMDAVGSYSDLSIDTSGNVVKGGSSSLRYKTNLVPVESGRYMGLLKLSAYNFNYKSSGIPSFGLIAEELHSLGYGELVMYDENRRPDNIHYKLLAVALLQLIKDIRKDMYSGDVGPSAPEKNNVTKVVKEDYTTNGEYLIVVTDDSTITLNSDVDTRVKIKSLSTTIVVPNIGLIDNKWETVELDNDSSVEFVFVSDLNYWVIVSSDGIKDS